MPKYFSIVLMFALAACGGSKKETPPKSDAEYASELCAVEYACYPEWYSSPAACERDILGELTDSRSHSEACGDATQELFACLTRLEDCAALDEYWDEEGGAGGYPCFAEDQALYRACYGDPGRDGEVDRDIAEEFCQLEYACYSEDYGNQAECQAEVAEEIYWGRGESAPCGQALRAFYSCLGGLRTCDELDEAWEAEPGTPCVDEESAVYDLCPVDY